jgi:hypothetical protein
MKHIKTSELKRGDIFTKKMEIKDREAFAVLEVMETYKGRKLLVKSRNVTLKTVEPKTISANEKEIIWLRNDPNI